MKYVLLFILIAVSMRCFAPDSNVITLIYYQPVQRYAKLIDAVVKIESGGNNYAYNEKENAVGAFQIRQCRIEHYNKLTGKNYELSDMYDYDKAKEVFVYFACGFNTDEQIAKRWNGSGPLTEIYWNKVKNYL